MQPDFIVIGAMKCATSTVRAYLEDHPHIFMAQQEPNFFGDDKIFERGLNWYARLFADRTTEILCGEGSNSYSAGVKYPNTAARMAEVCPQVKLIYMVRHPVERLVSAWVQNRVDSGDVFPSTVDEAVAAMPERYIDQSLYWRNISRYRALFPDAQIFVGFMEDLKADAPAFFRQLTEFLGVPAVPDVRRAHLNPTSGKEVPSSVYTAVNRMPLSGAIKRLLPTGLKQSVKRRLLSRPASEVGFLSPTVHAEVLAELRDDATTFLWHYGKPRNFWDLEARSAHAPRHGPGRGCHGR